MDDYLDSKSKCEYPHPISAFEEQEYKKWLDYLKRHPVKYMEKILGVKLKWYQKIMLNIFK